MTLDNSRLEDNKCINNDVEVTVQLFQYKDKLMVMLIQDRL